MSTTYQLNKLHNGWPIASVHLPHSESAAVGILIPVGSRHEIPGEEGIAHFLEHMFFKGTTTRSARDIVTEIEGYGGTLNAWTTEDHTFYEARGPEDLLETMILVLSDMFFNSTCEQEEIDRERGVICEEIIMYQENPGDHINDLMSASTWPNHPLGKPVAGTIESVSQMTRGQIVKFAEQNYYSDKTIFCVAAPQPHEEVIKLWEAATKNKKCSLSEPKTSPFNPSNYLPEKIVQTAEIEQAHIGISFLTEGSLSEKRHALCVLSTLFGETMSSRLFQRLREEAGVCYHVQSDLSLFHEVGTFSISAGLDSEQLSSSLTIIGKEISNLLDHHHGPSDEEVEQAKRYLIGQHRISFETSTAQMNWAASSAFTYGMIKEPQSTRNAIRKVTRNEVLSVAKEIFAPEKAALAAIGPIQKDAVAISW